MASEKGFRIEFIRFANGQELGPLRFDGDVVATCLEGDFAVGLEEQIATPLTQVVVPQGESLKIRCVSRRGAVQIIWAPPFAAVQPE